MVPKGKPPAERKALAPVNEGASLHMFFKKSSSKPQVIDLDAEDEL